MVVVAEILLADRSLPLVGLADSIPSGELSISNSFTLDDNRLLFTVSVAADSRDALERELETRSHISDVVDIGEAVDGWFYQFVLNDDSNLVAALNPEEFEGVVLGATVTGEGFRERKVFSDYDAFRSLQDRFEVHDIPFELLNIAADPENTGERDQFGLTDKQYEAISLAFSRGYYDSPRQFSTEELANELDVSNSAAADLLRRAEKQLISETVGPEQYADLLTH